MATILFTHGVPMSQYFDLKANKLIIPSPGAAFSRDELLSMLPQCDAVVACGVFDAELFSACKQARLVVSYGAGYDSLDIGAATRLGVSVANIPDSVTEATAQLAMAHILTVSRRICEMDRRLRLPGSTRELFTMGQTMGVSLEGMTLGIVGMGRIGARVAEFGRFIGMRIVYTNRAIKPYSVAGNARRMPLTELLKVSDVVSLHCPLTPQTKGLLGQAELALMRPTAFIINTSRGKLIDEQALIEALEEKRIAGAALDVFQTEPEVSDRLKMVENVVITPHIGGNTLRTRNMMAEQCAHSIREALADRRPPHLLNPEVWLAAHTVKQLWD